MLRNIISFALVALLVISGSLVPQASEARGLFNWFGGDKDKGELEASASGDAMVSANTQLPFGISIAPGIEKRLKNGKDLPPGIAKKVKNSDTDDDDDRERSERRDRDDDDENENDDDDRDTQAPNLRQVRAYAVTDTSARIVWWTTERGDTRVWANAGTTVDTSIEPTVHMQRQSYLHIATLTGLSAETGYSYAVGSADAAGNLAVSDTLTFTTAPSPEPEPDITAPVITGIQSVDVGEISARILWKTDESSTGRVLVSEATPVLESGSIIVADTQLTMEHAVTVSSLKAGTRYYFRVEATDASGNAKSSEVYTFNTVSLDTEEPTVFGPLVFNVGTSTVTLVWATSESSDSRVWFGTTSPLDVSVTSSLSVDARTYFHVVRLTGLTPGTRYVALVGSADAEGNLGFSEETEFTTDAQPADDTQE